MKTHRKGTLDHLSNQVRRKYTIELCQRIGATVYATCSDEKRAYLESRGIKHIYNSRDTRFSEALLKDTHSKGVDVVLNSLTSEGFIEASMACLRTGGVFLEIDKRNIYTQEQMRSDLHYHIIALDALAEEHPVQVGEMLNVIKMRMDNKELHALPIECFNIERSISAFEQLQRAKNIGKIVTTQAAMLTADAHILIAGGLGALGSVLTHWLYEQGVAHLSVVSRRAPEHPEPYIDYYQADITNAAQVKQIIKEAHKKHPLIGIFHLAGVLDDGVFAEQTPERFKKVCDTKALGALNLHEASKDLPLDYFVLFSSIASSMGSPGQTNYAAANSFLDQLAEYRQQQGLPAQSIQWGPWLEAGMAANLVAEHARKGLKALKTKEALAALSAVWHSALPVIQIADIDWKAIAKRSVFAPWMLLMAKNTKIDEQGQWITLLWQVEKPERHALLQSELTRLIEEISGIKDIAPDKGFSDVGIDSLMAVEVRNRIQQAIGSQYNLSNTLLFEHTSISELSSYISSILMNLFGENLNKPNIEVSVHNHVNYLKRYQKTFTNFDQLKFCEIKTSSGLIVETVRGGSGIPIVFCPPFNMLMSAWYKQFSTLINDFDVISFNYPGIGRSEFDSDKSTFKGIALLLFDVLEQLKINEPFNLVGWSLGSLLAQTIAANHPNKVQSLILVNPLVQEDASVYYQASKILKEDFLAHSGKNVRRLWNNITCTQFVSSLIHYEELVNFDYVNIPRAISAHTLIIGGRKDKITPVAYTQQLQGKINHCAYHTITDAGHFIPIFNYKKFNKLLIDFMGT